MEVFIRGHCPPVGFASTYMQRVRLRRTALRAIPRMNTSTQLSEGAGGSRSKAKATAKSTTGVSFLCSSELAREKRPDTALIQTTRAIVDVYRWQASSYNFDRVNPIPCRSRLAGDGGVSSNIFIG